MKRLFCLISIAMLSSFFVPHAFAAQIFIQQDASGAFDVMLDPQGQSVNAFQGSVILPAGARVDVVDDSDSIMSVWAQAPHVTADATSGAETIEASGIVVGGFAGLRSPFYSGVKPGPLFRFTLSGAFAGQISFADVQVLLNDGKGTTAQTTLTPFAVPSGSESANPDDDTSSPDPFVPEISRSPDIFDGQWFVAFSTRDQGSGVDHYEVEESQTATSAGGQWIVAGSPYLLSDQSRKSYVFIKAVDHANNQRIEMVPPQQSLYSRYTPLVALVVALALIVFSVFYLIYH